VRRKLSSLEGRELTTKKKEMGEEESLTASSFFLKNLT